LFRDFAFRSKPRNLVVHAAFLNTTQRIANLLPLAVPLGLGQFGQARHAYPNRQRHAFRVSSLTHSPMLLWSNFRSDFAIDFAIQW
jgi:hypothetical protein